MSLHVPFGVRAPGPALPSSTPQPLRRLHRFFEASVDRDPHAVAVLDDGATLSYQNLDGRANRLAHLLARRGIGPGHRVGILLHRSALTYTALLGVGKSGAAFVPIDPASPADRVRYIAEDAGLDLLLTSSDLLSTATGAGCPVLPLDDLDGRLGAEPDSRLDLSDEGDPGAYVIYTSGSSGRPKGVEVAQSSICNFISVVPGVYDVRATDRVYQGMTISFDFSIEEIWPTFAVGATLVVGPNDSRRLGAELADFLDDTGVTLFYCVPTLLATIPRDLPAVRGLLVGGEACPAGLVERWARPGRRMLNTYGPTEGTVTATWGELLPGRPVTIGRPMPTYSIVILDDDRREVAHGAAGEICIGGPGVANGYVGMPEKTADKFIVHEGRRIYRTGDLGRWDDDGEIVYLGRADDEVKIRGHRVDLGEIDSLLLDDADVESAVAAMLAVNGSDELVAYVTRRGFDDGSGDDADLVARLHAGLRDRVPDYMVPGYLEVLPALPTMPSGKVDRKQLPAPSGRRIVTATGAVVAAEGEMEHHVLASWATAFGLEPDELSVTADFFTDLGGHSLLAARAVSLLRERGLGVQPAVRDLYANPTVRAMAGHLQSKVDTAKPAGASTRPAPARVSSGRYGWAGTVQAAFLYALLLLLTLPVAGVYAATSGRVSILVLCVIALVATGVYLVLRWLLAPLFVGVLGQGIRPGRYRLWGGTHLALWAMDTMLALAPLPVLSGSPLMAHYLRALGARVGRDVHIGTALVSLPAFVGIGDGASIGYGVSLRPWVVEDGWVIVAPITVGAGAHVGAGVVLEPGASVGAHAVLAEQSTTVRGQHVPAGQRWAGSPSAPSDRIDPAVAELEQRTAAPGWTTGQIAGIVAGLGMLELLPVVMLVPTILVVWSALLLFGQVVGLLAALLVGPVFVVTVCVTVLVVHTLVLRRTPLGVFPARSALGVRKWVADKLLEMSLEFTNSLYATLYTVPWLRSLGARIGRGSEVSTVAHLDPDLLTLGAGSFIADMASIGGATFGHGYVMFRPTVVGERAFVGNAALVTPGAELGDGSLVGVHTVPPPEVPDGSSWLGSPAMNLPARQDSGDFAENLTFAPTRYRVAERLAIEFLRVTLPASIIAVVVYLYLLSLATMAALGGGAALIGLLSPAFALLFGLLATCFVAAVKWVVIGRYRQRVEPLWSRFVRRAEFVTGLYEAAAVPAFLYLLIGTPMLPPVLRLFGADIGRRTYLATTFLTEFDLVEIEDDATVGRNVSLQTHLFEDRVMKCSTVKIGERATVGDRAIVLYDATVGDDASLEPLSLVMKGESLPAGTRWRGIPAEGVSS